MPFTETFFLPLSFSLIKLLMITGGELFRDTYHDVIDLFRNLCLLILAKFQIKLKPEDILSRYKSVSCLPTWSFLIHLALNHINDLKVKRCSLELIIFISFLCIIRKVISKQFKI